MGFASCSSRLCFPRCAPKSEGVLGLDEVRDASALLECRLAQRQRARARRGERPARVVQHVRRRIGQAFVDGSLFPLQPG